MITKNKLAFCIILLVLLSHINGQKKIMYPKSKKVEQMDDYFGTRVADPYRWLEDQDAPEVSEWVTQQNQTTSSYLQKIPYRQKIVERLRKIWNYPRHSTPFKKGENYFFSKNDGLQNQSVFYVQKSLTAEPEVFLDPNTFSADGTVSLGDLSFSKDGRYIAYSISQSGSDWREILVMETENRKKLADYLQKVKFSDISWHGEGFFYSRYEQEQDHSSRNQYHQVYYHRLGTKQSEDQLIYEDRENPLRIFYTATTEDERFLALYAFESGSTGNALYVRDLHQDKVSFVAIEKTFVHNCRVIDNFDGKLLVLTNRNAARKKLLLVDPADPQNAEEILAEREEVLQQVSVVGDRIIAVYMKNASHYVHVHDFTGKFLATIDLPTLGTVTGFSGTKEDGETFYSFTSFTYPNTIYRYDVKTGKSSLFRQSQVDFDSEQYVTRQVFYNSKDGTRVPMFIVHKKGIECNGQNPTLLYGYGGFNISLLPNFDVSRLILLEHGGIYAQANLRGGGEYGEEWHQAGMLSSKQNVFDDFIGAAEYLIAKKYTSSEKLAISGRSNGGLLVGSAMTQRPKLFRVAFPAVGVMDMLRFHKFTIGWAWVGEYGSSDDAEQFRSLYSYSPLHNIKNGVYYPATLVTTADHDDRVVPAHSFKFMATLQEYQGGDKPVLIRIETKAGHGAGVPMSKYIEEAADIWSFMFYNLEMTCAY